MKVNEMFDILLLVIWLALASTITIFSLQKIDSCIKNYTMGDKLVLSPDYIDEPIDFELTSQDVLLACIIADEYQPYPARISVNSNSPVEFNTTYFRSVSTQINNIWNSQLSSIINQRVSDVDIKLDGGGKAIWQINTY